MTATAGRADREPAGEGRPARIRAAAAVLALAGLAAALAGLGAWQVQRRAWKLDLIAQVEARLAAAPVPAPGPGAWPGIGPSDAYRRVVATGVFDHHHETSVQAVTELGPGSWLITPLRTEAGWTIFVNRGFVRTGRRDPATRAAGQPAGPSSVAGLLRLSEPGGGFLRRNDPAAGRWYSRDVAAMAAAHGLDGVAPYFIDAEAGPNPGDEPVGGLTVVTFANQHLVYAVTWFTLALMAAAGALLLGRDAWSARALTRR